MFIIIFLQTMANNIIMYSQSDRVAIAATTQGLFWRSSALLVVLGVNAEDLLSGIQSSLAGVGS